jgi:NADH:ubiquinone oxidoreductase subunit
MLNIVIFSNFHNLMIKNHKDTQSFVFLKKYSIASKISPKKRNWIHAQLWHVEVCYYEV